MTDCSFAFGVCDEQPTCYVWFDLCAHFNCEGHPYCDVHADLHRDSPNVDRIVNYD